ncbi:MAG: hypothetical protein M3O26_10645 [Pseudomonadota bacterium]|nr:hypothetical protein [Pseudomonadota bacterium]
MASAAKKTVGRDINAFRESHDKNCIVPKKIEQGLKLLGPDQWHYQPDFIKLCEISVTDLAMFREQYSDFFVEIRAKTRKVVWCGSKALATKLRQMV